ENREEFLRSAKKNVEKTGLSSQVTFRNMDPSEGFLELNADAAVIDLGDPWKMVGPAWEALAGGGMLAGFTPTVNQLEKLAEALRILPAYLNYEIWKTGFNPVVSMAISLQLFAIGIVIFILAVGKERLAPKSQPQ